MNLAPLLFRLAFLPCAQYAPGSARFVTLQPTTGTLGCAVGCKVSEVGEATIEDSKSSGVCATASALGAVRAAAGIGFSPPVKLRIRAINVTRAARARSKRRRQYTTDSSGPTGCTTPVPYLRYSAN